MFKLFSWLKPNPKNNYLKPQQFVEIKRGNSEVSFIHPGHPLYDNLVETEKNQTNLIAPNDAAYNENSLVHNFVAINSYQGQKYLIINSFKHFKEQSIGGLLQYDENIYNVIAFYENNEEYQTGNSYSFSETYEYDHPVESYAFIANHNNKITKITLERGKKPLTINLIDKKRALFSEKLSKEAIELIDYVIMPAIKAYNKILEKHKHKAS